MKRKPNRQPATLDAGRHPPPPRDGDAGQLPPQVRTRREDLHYRLAEEVRMGCYESGWLRVGERSIQIDPPFVASPDGRYLAGTCAHDTIAVFVDLDSGRSESLGIAGCKVRPIAFAAGAFRFVTRAHPYRVDGDPVEITVAEVFGAT